MTQITHARNVQTTCLCKKKTLITCLRPWVLGLWTCFLDPRPCAQDLWSESWVSVCSVIIINCDKKLLQSVTGAKKCDNYLYKVRRNDGE